MEMLDETAAATDTTGQGRLDPLLVVHYGAESTGQSQSAHRQNRQEEPSERGSWCRRNGNRQARGLSGGGFVRASVVRVDRAALRAARVNSAESGHQ